MKEELLYFVWKFKLFNTYDLFDLLFHEFQIVYPGKQNFDSGPDFIESRIKVDEAVWVGNVEIHLRSSDWYRHGHHLDKAFNNVILHVVRHHDKPVISENGRLIPVIQLEISEGIVEKYLDYQKNKSFIPCARDIGQVSPFKIRMWLGKVLVERLMEKSSRIEQLLNRNKNSWEETFYQLIARGFGFKVNAEPFELLAKSLPLCKLAKHHRNRNQLEALLFGQAGFLEEILMPGEYYAELKKEYDYLKQKYQLKSLEKHLWKFLRIRPSCFPTIRISQFADLIHHSNALFSKIIECESVEQIKGFFHVQASAYWDHHYQFEKPAEYRKKAMGYQSVDLILINTVIPLLFVYGQLTGKEALEERALTYLDQITAEKNSLLKNWNSIGIQGTSAFYSQALIHQKKAYCSTIRCLECGIGAEIFKISMHKN